MHSLPHTPQDGYYEKIRKITSVDKGVEKLEHLCAVGRNVKWCDHYGK